MKNIELLKYKIESAVNSYCLESGEEDFECSVSISASDGEADCAVINELKSLVYNQPTQPKFVQMESGIILRLDMIECIHEEDNELWTAGTPSAFQLTATDIAKIKEYIEIV